MKFPQRRKLPFESMIFNSVSKYNLRRSSSHLILSLQFLYDALAVVVCFFSTGKPSQRAPTVYCFHVPDNDVKRNRHPRSRNVHHSRCSSWCRVDVMERLKTVKVKPPVLVSVLVRTSSSQSEASITGTRAGAPSSACVPVRFFGKKFLF